MTVNHGHSIINYDTQDKTLFPWQHNTTRGEVLFSEATL